jgi:hypothetical protein
MENGLFSDLFTLDYHRVFHALHRSKIILTRLQANYLNLQNEQILTLPNTNSIFLDPTS